MPFGASVQSQGYVVAVEGLAGLDEDFEASRDRVRDLAAKAINATARKYRTQSSRDMREQIAFPARYLDSRDKGRLRVSRNANAASLEAAISGRFEPTSLATFVKGAKRHGRRSPRMEVKTGRTTQIGRSFMMNLRGGNIGLAIRLRPGESIQNKHHAIAFTKADPSLYLLYGPSVDQVFRDVSQDVAPDAAEYLETEFLRLTEALI